MDGLLCVEFLGVLHVESQEVAEFCCSIDFGLPCILSLSKHCECHQFVPIFSGYQICCFQEYCCSVGEGHGFPC